MISWLQSIFFKHFKWLFALLLIVVIVSFVLMSSPMVDPNSSQKRPSKIIFGYDFNSPRETKLLLEKIKISNKFNLISQQTLPIVFERLACLSLAHQCNIPEPTEEERINYIRSRPLFIKDNSFSVKAYQQFLDEIKANGELSENKIIEVIDEEIVIDQVKALFESSPNFILGFEAQEFLKKQKTIWSVQIAELNYKNFKHTQSEVDEQAVKHFFESYQKHYQVPEKITVSAILLKKENYTEQITVNTAPSEDVLRTYYEDNKWRFNNPPSTQPLKEKPFEQVKTTVKETWLEEQKENQSQLAAEYAAVDFSMTLHQDKIHNASESFYNLIKNSNAQQITIPPFSKNHPPDNTPVPAFQLNKQAFLLNKTRYFSTEPIYSPQGAIILIYENKIPSHQPELHEITDNVKKDYQESERKKAYLQQGEEIQKMITTDLVQGKSFHESAKTKGMQVQSVENFSAENPPNSPYRWTLLSFDSSGKISVSPLIASLEIGEVSKFTNGKIIYISKKSPPPIKPLSKTSSATAELNRSRIKEAYQSLLAEMIFDELETKQ
jgi:peptidyl-prolyl cis-trans isomerase D